MADKFVQIRDGASNNIYPNLNLSPFADQFFTTSTIGGRARITLAESAYMIASAVTPTDSGKNMYGLAGRVAVVNPNDNVLSNLTSRLAHGQTLPDNYLWLSANTWIVPSLREVASAFAFNVPASCTSATYATIAESTTTVSGKIVSKITQAGSTVTYSMTDGTTSTYTCTSAQYAFKTSSAYSATSATSAIGAGKVGAITLTSAQYATSAEYTTNASYADSAGLANLVSASAISSNLLKNFGTGGNGKVLKMTVTGTTSTITWGTDNTSAGVTKLVAGTGISLNPTGGTGQVTINCTVTPESSATVSLAKYAGYEGEGCTTSDAGRVGTLCYQNLAALYNMCVNGSAGSMAYTGWDNSYTVPSVGAVAQLLADIVQNILRNGSGWNGTVSTDATTT